MADPGIGDERRKEWIATDTVKSVDLALLAVPDFMKSMFEQVLKTSGKTALQPSRLALVLHVIIGKASPVDKATIWASLENSVISSGPMSINQNDKKGYYQDRIEVDMWLEDTSGHPVTEFLRTADGPQTVNGSSSTSSSVSFSFSGNVSANVGFFGGTPTGGVGAGASVGVSESHSFSRNLQDFKCVNSSTDLVAHHAYQMSASSGGAYNSAKDLVPDGKSIGFLEVFEGIKLYTPPDLATANLELLSQCVWQATSVKDFGNLVLKIAIRQHSVMVDGTNNFVTVDGHSQGVTAWYSHTEPLPMSALAIKPGMAF